MVEALGFLDFIAGLLFLPGQEWMEAFTRWIEDIFANDKIVTGEWRI